MRFVIQRVSSASVTIDGKVRGEIGKGFVVLIGIGEDDTKEIADKITYSNIEDGVAYALDNLI